MNIPELLLWFGLTFPAIAWLSVVTGVLTLLRGRKESVSFLFFPFVGPILLTCWILVKGHSPWWILVVWLCDIGTIGSLPSLPRLFREMWNISRFTQIMEFRGDQGTQSVLITLHTAGNYVFQKTWTLDKGETGIKTLGESGTFEFDADMIVLRSHLGVTRRLTLNDVGQYIVDENLGERADLQPYSLNGWSLSCHPIGK